MYYMKNILVEDYRIKNNILLKLPNSAAWFHVIFRPSTLKLETKDWPETSAHLAKLHDAAFLKIMFIVTEVRSLFLRVLKTIVLELSMLSVCGTASFVSTDSGTE